MAKSLFSILKFIPVDLSQIEMGEGMIGIDPNLFFKGLNDLVKSFLGCVDNGQEIMDLRKVGIGLNKRLVGLFSSFILLIFEIDSSHCVINYHQCGVDLERLLSHPDRL